MSFEIALIPPLSTSLRVMSLWRYSSYAASRRVLCGVNLMIKDAIRSNGR